MHIATIYEYVKAAWALRIRRQYGTDTVVTEFGFPPPQGKFNLRAPVRRSLRNINMVMTALLLGLLAPGAFLYVTVMREPVKRLISNFFWRYRRFFSGQHEPVAPAARRQQPMPLLGSNRASDLANGSMDPDRAWLHSFCRSEPYHKVLDVKRERKSSQIFT